MASTSNDKQVYVAVEEMEMEMEAQAGYVGEYSRLCWLHARAGACFLEIKQGGTVGVKERFGLGSALTRKLGDV